MSRYHGHRRSVDQAAGAGPRSRLELNRQADICAGCPGAGRGQYSSGRVRPIVHTRLPLDEGVKAHELMEARTQLGKVVLVP
ncbi:zinc-binding dehydrogenase [Micromonospora sp. NPDC049662]|uniref:zinc-binding dehydrogenase n=1 Tax=Micromonospora sp. NPDC049662 TaxID=3155397 RepID=UPI00341F9123